MICVDWRMCAPHEVAPLLAAETQAWRRDLHWDVTEAWRVVEPARRAGQLPGFVARDERGPRGWTAFLLHGASLQVLAFAASDALASEALVDAILTSPEAAQAESVIFCVRAGASPLSQTLATRGFQLDPYRYLSLDLTALSHNPLPTTDSVRDASKGVRAWADDRDAFADLCARAYAGSTEVRAFAPSGSPDEWHDYVESLLGGPGCGWFRPEFSFVLPGARGRALAGAVFVTDLGLSTAHVAQVVVDPALRGRGVAQRLMHAAACAAATSRFLRMTLLVSAVNRPAAAVYARMGFRDRAEFVVATRSQPSLSTRDALATGGESTRL
ncbi:MAG: GNAT family N-acetyltransferase [Acidobacteriota bacterium]